MSSFADLADRFLRADSSAPRQLATAGLVAVLAVQAVRLGWAALAPIGPVGTPAPPPAVKPLSADFGLLDRFDPFHRVGLANAAPSPASVNLQLFGVRAAGDRSTAILAGADGRQSVFGVGEEVSPGVVLAAVASDHVVLETGGRRSSVFFPKPGAVSPAVYTPPPPAVAATPASAPAGVALPAGGPAGELLSQAGLQPGDVVLSVNGQGVAEAGKVEALGRDLAEGGEAVVQFERAGQVRTATVRIPQS